MKGRQGFTLMELLVVLLIIGILSTVALRTIDATRDRSLFDQTSKEMNQLVQAMVGNPDLSYDGRRVDFGYYGDMEQLPPNDDLRDLVRNTTGSTAWHGPYFKLTSTDDTASFRFDGWSREYNYHTVEGSIWSGGNGKFPMTVKIVDDTSQLNNNIIAGTITDRDGAAPGDITVSRCSLKLYYNNPDAQGGIVFAGVLSEPGGYYEISNTPAGGSSKVPIGLHKLVASTGTGGESLIRYVTVLPRSKTIVDFKFTSSFWNKLRMVGPPRLNVDSTGFEIDVINDQTTDVTVSYLNFLLTSEPLHMREFRIGSDHIYTGVGLPGDGPGDTLYFSAPVTIGPNGTDKAVLGFFDFHVDSLGTDMPATKVNGNTFEFRFSDGSEITVKP